jgi:hypothetical protein
VKQNPRNHVKVNGVPTHPKSRCEKVSTFYSPWILVNRKASLFIIIEALRKYWL